jgi:hypothetical protein
MKMKRIFRRPVGLVILAAALVAAGCIVSGQFIVVIDWGGFASTDEQLNSEHVDLTTNETWQDHKDNIEDIIDVKFKVTITNHEATAATGEVYVSKDHYTTLTDVTTSATRVLHGISIDPGATRTIDFDESVAYRENLSTLLDLVKDGEFYVYGIAESTPFSIEIMDGSQLLITLSAGK